MTLHVLESVDSRGITFPVLPSGGTGYINANEVKVGHDITSHLAIRQALNIGLSRQGIIDVTMDGYGKAAYSIVDGTPWFNEKTVIEDGRVEEAKQLLADAGWVDTNKDGIVEKDGLKAEFDLYFPSSDQLRGDIALAVADQALGLGIKINIIGATWDEIFVQGKANACLWGGGRLHPHQLYTMYSSQVINAGYNNMPSYINPTSDDYIKKALYASTQEEANQTVRPNRTGASETPARSMAFRMHLFEWSRSINGRCCVHVSKNPQALSAHDYPDAGLIHPDLLVDPFVSD